MAAAAHRIGQFLVQFHPAGQQGIAVGQTFNVVMQHMIRVFPDDLAFPGVLPERVVAAPHPQDSLLQWQRPELLRRLRSLVLFSSIAGQQQVAIVQQAGVAGFDSFGEPAMHDAAPHVEQQNVLAAKRGQQRVTLEGAAGVVVR